MITLKNNNLIPIILCGGSGSRLWPLSRKSFPKQFWSLDANSNKTLLQNTILRLKNFKAISEPIIVCNQEHRFLVAEQCREININPKEIILEPISQNTAPAIIFSSLKALEINNDANVIVLSSDHIIPNEKQFLEAIEYGLGFINNNKIVTFGVVASRPETGYGYIKTDKKIDTNNLEHYAIKNFIEKPGEEKAKNSPAK